jgi:hypothetical protein
MSGDRFGHPAERRCVARSKRTGLQCASNAIVGGTVCKHHGGAAPQVLAAARRRLVEAADAVSVLIDLLDSGNERVRRAAATDLLDRAGMFRGERIVIDDDEADDHADIDELNEQIEAWFERQREKIRAELRRSDGGPPPAAQEREPGT